MQEWFYAVDGDRRGPVTLSELKQLIADGKVQADDLVWKDGMAEWTMAKSVDGLIGNRAKPADSRSRNEKADDRPRRRRDDDDDDDDDDRPRSRDNDRDDYDDERRSKSSRGMPKDISSTKTAAGVLGIIFGSLGVHKFYLGMTGPGLLQIAITIFSCGIGGWLGIIEGIIYLTKSDREFYQTYIVEKKQWF